MRGARLRDALHKLATEFDRIARPSRGYATQPARVSDGSAYA
jgi:hypothetical protein